MFNSYVKLPEGIQYLRTLWEWCYGKDSSGGHLIKAVLVEMAVQACIGSVPILEYQKPISWLISVYHHSSFIFSSYSLVD